MTTHETLPEYVGFITVWLFLIFNVVFGIIFAKLYWRYKLYPQILEYREKYRNVKKKVSELIKDKKSQETDD